METDRESRSPARGSDANHVPMLDGIRAFAVLAVMAYHAGVLVPRGGFFGVDTFFTLSGFLITSLLIREWDRTDGIVLPAFWMRRARRLLPALCLMLAALAVYSQLAHQSGRWPTLGSDEVASLFYFANWHFLATGADYFNQSSATSPVNHTWSLAIEEQFYLLWPLIVLVCLRLRTSRVVLLAVAAGGTIASAVDMAVLYRPDNISRVYYGTDTRAQSLLIGATLAILLSFRPAASEAPGLVPRSRFMPGPGRRVALEALGLAGIAGSAVIWIDLSSSSTLTYLGGFGLAGLATCAVIACVILQPKSLVSRLLSVRPLVFIGCISYGMYLWHYPLFMVLDGQHTGLKTYPLFLLRSAVTILVATASYYWLEQPIRRMRRPAQLGQKVLIAAGGVTAAAIVLAAGLPTGGRPASADASSPAPASAVPEVAATGRGTRVLIVGDSLAKTLGNGVSRDVKMFFGNQERLTGGLASTGSYFGLDIVNGGTVNCALAAGLYRVRESTPAEPFGACNPGPGQPARPADWVPIVARFKPQVSLFVSRLDITDHLFRGRWTHIGDPAYDAYLLGLIEQAVKVLTADGGKVVLLTTPYFSTGEQPNGEPFPEDNPVRVDEYNAMLRQVAGMHPGQVFVFDLNALMDAGRKPLTTIDGVTVRFSDGIHFTPAGDCWLAPRILPFVEKVASPTGTVTKAPSSVPASVCTDVAETLSF